MKNHRRAHRPDGRVTQPPREARLHALLFTGATLGTTLSPGASDGPKIPAFVGE